MNKLPDREILLKQFEIICLAIEKNSKNIRSDALACLAGMNNCSVKELKEILFD